MLKPRIVGRTTPDTAVASTVTARHHPLSQGEGLGASVSGEQRDEEQAHASYCGRERCSVQKYKSTTTSGQVSQQRACGEVQLEELDAEAECTRRQTSSSPSTTPNTVSRRFQHPQQQRQPPSIHHSSSALGSRSSVTRIVPKLLQGWRTSLNLKLQGPNKLKQIIATSHSSRHRFGEHGCDNSIL
jgi:hypothetical protein